MGGREIYYTLGVVASVLAGDQTHGTNKYLGYSLNAQGAVSTPKVHAVHGDRALKGDPVWREEPWRKGFEPLEVAE